MSKTIIKNVIWQSYHIKKKFRNKINYQKIFYANLLYFEIYLYDCHIIFFIIAFWHQTIEKIMEEDIYNYSPIVIIRGTPCMSI